MNNKILMFAFVFLLLIVSAQAQTFKKDQSGQLQVSCDSLNCSDSYNITITWPNSSIAVDNEEASISNGYLYFDINSNLTSLLGTYPFYLHSQSNDFSLSYDVTQSGINPSLAQSLIYGVIFIFALVIFLALFVPGVLIDASRKTNIQGLVEWNGRIYLKIFVLMMSDLAFLFLTFISWRMAFYFLPIDFVSSILRTLFITNMIVTPIVIIVGTIIVFTLILFDKNARDLMARGIDPNVR